MTKPIEPDKSNEAGGANRRDRTASRKAYRRPELTEYGSVAKLTQGTMTKQNDASGGGFAMTQQCL